MSEPPERIYRRQRAAQSCGAGGIDPARAAACTANLKARLHVKLAKRIQACASTVNQVCKQSVLESIRFQTGSVNQKVRFYHALRMPAVRQGNAQLSR
jgi:hypothetical protein